MYIPQWVNHTLYIIKYTNFINLSNLGMESSLVPDGTLIEAILS